MPVISLVSNNVLFNQRLGDCMWYSGLSEKDTWRGMTPDNDRELLLRVALLKCTVDRGK
jgi:hypothetical protein